MGELNPKKSDIIALWRPMTQAESDRADELLPVVCSSLREEERKVGKDLDAMIAEDDELAEVAKSVTDLNIQNFAHLVHLQFRTGANPLPQQ